MRLHDPTLKGSHNSDIVRPLQGRITLRILPRVSSLRSSTLGFNVRRLWRQERRSRPVRFASPVLPFSPSPLLPYSSSPRPPRPSRCTHHSARITYLLMDSDVLIIGG